MILSIDPGEHVGWATWHNNGILIGNDKMGYDEFIGELAIGRWSSAQRLVRENFRLFRHKAQVQTGSKMPAARALGALDLWASIHGIPVTDQEPGILKVTAMHAGIEIPKGHIPDKLSAFLHGRHYFESNGVVYSGL